MERVYCFLPFFAFFDHFWPFWHILNHFVPFWTILNHLRTHTHTARSHNKRTRAHCALAQQAHTRTLSGLQDMFPPADLGQCQSSLTTILMLRCFWIAIFLDFFGLDNIIQQFQQFTQLSTVCPDCRSLQNKIKLFNIRLQIRKGISSLADTFYSSVFSLPAAWKIIIYLAGFHNPHF